MNKLLTDWLAALRSGKYKQGTGRLHYGNKYCCLGVACAVAEVPKVGGGFMFDGRNYSVLPPREILNSFALPEEMYSGCRSTIFVQKGAFLMSVDVLNDQNTTFSEIANLIEATYRKYKK
jgi:hypothetical protein